MGYIYFFLKTLLNIWVAYSYHIASILKEEENVSYYLTFISSLLFDFYLFIIF